MKTLSTIVAIIATTLSVSASADPVGGESTMSGYLEPGSSVGASVVLEGREVTRFTVTGSGSSDLDCVVFDALGHEMGRDDDDTDICIIDVQPRWRGRFTLRIANVGRNGAAYAARAY